MKLFTNSKQTKANIEDLDRVKELVDKYFDGYKTVVKVTRVSPFTEIKIVTDFKGSGLPVELRFNDKANTLYLESIDTLKRLPETRDIVSLSDRMKDLEDKLIQLSKGK